MESSLPKQFCHMDWKIIHFKIKTLDYWDFQSHEFQCICVILTTDTATQWVVILIKHHTVS